VSAGDSRRVSDRVPRERGQPLQQGQSSSCSCGGNAATSG
jgi:hypothetical protein